MPAYLIANVDVHDADAYEKYRLGVPETIARHGGRYLARGGETRLLEGTWEPRRLVILEFPNREAALGWYESDDYDEIAQVRRRTATTDLVLVDGIA